MAKGGDKVHVLISQLGSRLPDELFQSYLNQLPLHLQLDIVKYKRWRDIQARLFGKLLLHIGLTKYYDLSPDILDNIQFTKCARPYLSGVNIDFNISHTPHTVVCCITQGANIGIDIEEIEPTPIQEFREEFSTEEMERIQRSKNCLEKFYSYWTKKEAVVKAEGLGLGIIPMRQVSIHESERSASLFSKHWFLYDILSDGKMTGHIAIDNPIEKKTIVYETICFDDKKLIQSSINSQGSLVGSPTKTEPVLNS